MKLIKSQVENIESDRPPATPPHPTKGDRTSHTLAKNCHYHKKLIVS
ncbi:MULTISPECIES: hypothetical protein [unclassified Microcoleus]|nr:MULTISPECIES: hypothetical protein [unclassified Microcoleus]